MNNFDDLYIVFLYSRLTSSFEDFKSFPPDLARILMHAIHEMATTRTNIHRANFDEKIRILPMLIHFLENIKGRAPERGAPPIFQIPGRFILRSTD